MGYSQRRVWKKNVGSLSADSPKAIFLIRITINILILTKRGLFGIVIIGIGIIGIGIIIVSDVSARRMLDPS